MLPTPPPPAPPRPPPTPPTPPTPLGLWSLDDSGEVVALNMEYSSYATHQQFFSRTFSQVLASQLNTQIEALVVLDFVKSSAGSTLVYFAVLLSSTSSTDITNTFSAVQSLFSCQGPPDIGSPACPSLAAAFSAAGFPVDAFYNDQLSGAVMDSSIVTTDTAHIASWTNYAPSVVNMNILYSTFADGEVYYRSALTQALAQALGVPSIQVATTNYMPTADATTDVWFEFYFPETSDSAVHEYNARIDSLFTCPDRGCFATSVLQDAISQAGLDGTAYKGGVL
jgi:hypothetical protein